MPSKFKAKTKKNVENKKGKYFEPFKPSASKDIFCTNSNINSKIDNHLFGKTVLLSKVILHRKKTITIVKIKK